MKKLMLLLLCFSSFLLQAQSVQGVALKNKTSKKIMDGFMDLRFGMFIHWGPVTLRGTEIGWSRGTQVPVKEYDNLYKEFDPVLFNADAWVKTAKDAGMKYLTIVAKHHDGFCLWPSKYTSYNISNTPFKKDVVGALANACKKAGLKFCIYYSVLDWHQPDYPLHLSTGANPDPKADMSKYIIYMKNQLKELISNYHPYMLWFDGNWEKPWTQEMAVDMYNYIKKLDPKVIINNRLGKFDHETLTAESVGDFATPEQKVGKLNMDYPWESCITICTQWAWKPNDKMKSLKQCIQTLASTAGGNGNLLLNVGPMMDGRIEARQVERLKEVGNWLKIYGEAIYGTKGGPYKPDSIFSSTRKGNKIYLHVFQSSGDQFIIPAIPHLKILKACFLKGNRVAFEEDKKNITLSLPGKLLNENDAVIVLEMNANVGNIPIINRE
ncbi:MAG TPA: alpha-L-fucosidase [Hanamia sp.]|nr:alpha-L-fucosidase [Hanamia sp.]